MNARCVIAVAAVVAVVGCSTTKYMGPLPRPQVAEAAKGEKDRGREETSGEPVLPICSSEAPAASPRAATTPTITPTTVVLDNGQRVVLPAAGDQFLYVTTDHAQGALEGFVGGALFGAIIGALIVADASGDCAAGRGGCVESVPGVFIVSMLLNGAIGAIYGSHGGHRTTYRWGPTP